MSIVAMRARCAGADPGALGAAAAGAGAGAGSLVRGARAIGRHAVGVARDKLRARK